MHTTTASRPKMQRGERGRWWGKRKGKMTRAKGNKDFQFLGRWNNPEQVQTFRCSSSTYARKLNTKVSRRNQKIQNIYLS